MTAEQLVFRNLRLYEKIFVAAIFAWAAWGPVPRAKTAQMFPRNRPPPRFIRAMWPERTESAKV